jgi:hypothetical protein
MAGTLSAPEDTLIAGSRSSSIIRYTVARQTRSCAAFFVTLSVESSFIPTRDVIGEGGGTR